jgi:plasmid stability protein
MKTTKRATIYFDAHVHQALRLRAAASNRSISDMVNEAVQITLAEDADDLRAVEIRQTEERPIRAGSGVSMVWSVMAAKDFVARIQTEGAPCPC